MTQKTPTDRMFHAEAKRQLKERYNIDEDSCEVGPHDQAVDPRSNGAWVTCYLWVYNTDVPGFEDWEPDEK